MMSYWRSTNGCDICGREWSFGDNVFLESGHNDMPNKLICARCAVERTGWSTVFVGVYTSKYPSKPDK